MASDDFIRAELHRLDPGTVLTIMGHEVWKNSDKLYTVNGRGGLTFQQAVEEVLKLKPRPRIYL
jgi:hypothetical protein